MLDIATVSTVIEQIKRAQSSKDWENILNSHIDKQFHKDKALYPSISGLFQTDDIQKLPEKISQEILKSPLEKLLYAALWKNGDILKIQHIIDGLKGEDPGNSSMTFNYFGKFLANPAQSPIVDQHVIRAYRAVISEGLIAESLNGIGKSGLLDSKKDKDDVEAYIKWVKSCSTGSNEDVIQFYQVIDDVMFAFGKMIKKYVTNQ